MTFVAKPKVHHPALKLNEIGLHRRDYEGAVSTLCAGCGHDSVSAAIVQACAELSLPPHRFAKVSGIGLSLIHIPSPRDQRGSRMPSSA